MSETTIILVGLSQLLFGIWIGWLRWGRCRHEWVEHWWIAGRYLKCTHCGGTR